LYQMTITFSNINTDLQEPVLVQHYLCTPVNFSLHLRVHLFVY